MKIVAELVKWGESLELWQSDALRRIWSQGELTSEDIEEIYLGLKESRGINIEKKLGLQPLTASHIASGSVHKQVTVIKSLHSLENVNAIVPNQQLTFATKGVTLVYGENASGKSGYSRVLKRACRARGSLEPIYHNIFDANAQQLTAKANIDVQIDGTSERILEWSSNSTPPECLSNIGVFDSKSARVYVDEENAVWYVPYGLDALTKLAELSQVLKTRLNTEITGLNVEPPIVSQVVGLGKLFSNLDHEVSKEFILKQTEFGETEEKLLASLKKKHADLVANDPKIKAKKLRALRQRIINLVDQLSLVIDSISDESIASLVKIHKDSEDAKVAAEIVAKKTFETEPLSGIGSESWRQLFESAKRFSEQEAYVEKPFPVTGTEAYCVLCQQPLAEEASNRLSRFWEFIKNDSASNAEKKRKQFDEQLKLALKSEPFISSVDELLLEELEDLSPGIKKSILDTKTSLSNRITLVKLAVRQSYWAGMPSITSFPAETLKKIADSCERGALESEKNSRPGELETCEKNILLYNQKKIASQQQNTLIKYVEGLVKLRHLRECLASTNPIGITKKRSSLMEEAITEELGRGLREECKTLGVDHIPIQLKQHGRTGDTYHKVELRGSGTGNVDPSEVLSEGEQRVVAIASFLAELGTSQHSCGIIFDDPVSSLDHRYREKVAKRLVAESTKRQVIVFTHDIFFFLAMQRESEELKVPCHVQGVARMGNRVGLSSSDIPVIAMNTKQRIGLLHKHLQEVSKLYKDGNAMEYDKQIKLGYGILRDAWERAIEQVLFNDSIARFTPRIKPQSLKVVDFLPEDNDAIQSAWDRCSGISHDSSPGAQTEVPEPANFEADIKKLEGFIESIKQRRKSSTASSERTIDKKDSDSYKSTAKIAGKPQAPTRPYN